MGSYYMTCSISHMTLTRQKTSVLLLIPKMEYEGNTSLDEHKNLICTNDGAQAFFSPFGFPIKGEYDDCGQIDSIERDRNVDQLEKFFGEGIEDIIRHIGRTRNWKPSKNEELYEKLHMTFFRTEVLEFLERGWDKIDLENPKKHSSDEYLKKFIDLARNAPTAEQKQEVVEKRERGETLTEEEYDILFYSEYKVFGSNGSYIKASMDRNFHWLLKTDFYGQIDDVRKQASFLHRLGYGMDRILIPSIYGSQDTNFAETYLLNDFVNDLLVADMEEDSYDEDEDERRDGIIKSHNRNKSLRELGI